MGGMIPLSDASREPASFPVMTTAIIVTNVIVFVMELMGGDAFVMRWSEIPANITASRKSVTTKESALRTGLRSSTTPDAEAINSTANTPNSTGPILTLAAPARRPPSPGR